MTSAHAVVAVAAAGVLALAGCSAVADPAAGASPTAMSTADDDAIPSRLTRGTLEATTELTRSGIDPATGLDHRAIALFTDLDAEQRGADAVLEVAESALFDEGEQGVRPDAADLLADLVELAELTGEAPITIRGTGTTPPVVLAEPSETRGTALAAALVALGVDADRLTVSDGGSDESDGEAGRIEIVFEGVHIVGPDR